MDKDAKLLNEAYKTKVVKELNEQPVVNNQTSSPNLDSEDSLLADVSTKMDSLIDEINQVVNRIGGEYAEFRGPGIKQRVAQLIRKKIFEKLSRI